MGVSEKTLIFFVWTSRISGSASNWMASPFGLPADQGGVALLAVAIFPALSRFPDAHPRIIGHSVRGTHPELQRDLGFGQTPEVIAFCVVVWAGGVAGLGANVAVQVGADVAHANVLPVVPKIVVIIGSVRRGSPTVLLEAVAQSSG